MAPPRVRQGLIHSVKTQLTEGFRWKLFFFYIYNEITRVEWWLFVCAGDGVWSVWSIGQQDTSSSYSGWRRWLDGGEEEEVKILGWTVKLRDWSISPLTYRKRLFSESWASASTCSRLKGSCRLRKACCLSAACWDVQSGAGGRGRCP